jgi:hypothetical protein
MTGGLRLLGRDRRRSEWLTFVEALPLQTLDPAFSEWQAETLRWHRDFWIRRLARERAIADTLLDGAAAEFQPGLFDRRAVRARDVAAAEDQALREEVARRINTLDVESRATIGPPRAVLVLVAKRRP